MGPVISRRRLLQTAGALGAAGAVGSLAACDTAPSGAGGNGKGAPVSWWGFAEGLEAPNKKVFAAFEKKTGTPVEYSFHQVAEIGEALQLAKQSDQLPDVFMPGGLELPTSALINEGWYHPIDLGDEALDRLPDDSIFDGIHRFDGKLYTFPIFTHQQYWTVNWFSKKMASDAGVEPPKTYDDFRAAARKIMSTAGDKTYGWVFNLGMPDRVGLQVSDLAQAAGFGGSDGTLFTTGEIKYDDDAYLTVIEFLLSLQKDKLLMPGSSRLVDKDARLRWAAGGAGYFFDGPWCNGVVKTEAAEFLDQIDCSPILVPDAGLEPLSYKGPDGGQYFAGGSTKKIDKINQLLAMMTTEDYFASLAAGMDKVPLLPDAVEQSEAHPAYKKMVKFFQDQVYLAPVPVIKNSDVDLVDIEAKPIKPDLGDIVQGAFSGDVTDVKGQLKTLSDKKMKQREQNIAKAKKKGAEVDADDWAFPDWKPKQDYTYSK